METDEKIKARERARDIAAEHAGRGDHFGWFEALYKESEGDINGVPWADLAPNRFFKAWAEANKLEGEGRTAIVVGCGLGDDAAYLADLGFKVTAFDISPTAIQWAKKLYGDKNIDFEVGDLFAPPAEWLDAFEFVLEVYTIQPLPLEIRPRAIDAVAALAAVDGELVVVTRGRGDEEETDQLPWPLSRRDLGRFGENALREISFEEVQDVDEDEQLRFIVRYKKDARAAKINRAGRDG